MYLNINSVTTHRCTRCRACIKDCPQHLFACKDDTSVVFYDPLDQCIRCGHCIAVCPVDAIDFTSDQLPFLLPKSAPPDSILDKNALYTFFRARRSIRQYKDKAVDPALVSRILETMRHAPTASNRERIHYTIVTSSVLRLRLQKKVLGMFRFIKLLLTIIRAVIPFGRNGPGILGNGLFKSLVDTLKRAKDGHDPVFFHAPCIIILSSPKYSKQGAVDAGIALTHGIFCAQAEGLGSCLIGFAHEMLSRNRKMRATLQIPKSHTVQGVMVVGYPAVFYTKAPPRKPLSATFH
ncbi:MAG: nitroreductase family protein [Spirochaetales bacterium]|nr:nitroreductase family protein [Spirochaetales bacterium]